MFEAKQWKPEMVHKKYHPRNVTMKKKPLRQRFNRALPLLAINA